MPQPFSDVEIRTPILDMLTKYNSEKTVRFHMPGHKGRCSFYGFKGITYMSPLDVTEIPGTDNLHEPKEAILDAERLLARAYGARKSFILVNGSTCGILAAIGAAFKKGDRVIADENCHRSVFNGADLFGVEIVTLKNVTAGKIRETAESGGFRGVIVTRPDYYGICSDIKSIYKACRDLGLVLVTDEAHGAHLNFAGKGYPVSAVEYSDIIIQSAHKTIGGLNQSAFLHLNNEGIKFKDDIRKWLSVFQTSSPSYLIMASADCARATMERNGEELLEELRENINWAVKKITNETVFTVELNQGLPLGVERTPDRLVINTASGGFVGYSAEKFLRSEGVQVEMSDKERIVCLCSVFDERKDFEKLVGALKKMINYAKSMVEIFPNKSVSKRKREISEFKKLIGKKLKFDIVPYPPGTPFIKSGQVLTLKDFKEIEDMYMAGAVIMGVTAHKD